ncbi:MAG: glutathione S-transferase [Pseudomonadota bacterium]
MFTLHHLNDSRSQRIAWLLELAEVDYEVKAYLRDPETSLAPEELKRLHPLGTAPLLTHNGVTIAESGSICEYVAMHSTQNLMPEHGTTAYVHTSFWSHYAEGSFLPPLVTAMVVNKARSKVPFLIKPIANRLLDAIMNAYFNKAIKRNFVFTENYLENKTWLVGNMPTIADVQMSFALEAVYDAGRITAFPNMTNYVERLRQTGTFINAMNKLHEAEAQQSI